jgi:hypothetical protein
MDGSITMAVAVTVMPVLSLPHEGDIETGIRAEASEVNSREEDGVAVECSTEDEWVTVECSAEVEYVAVEYSAEEERVAVECSAVVE